MPVRRRVTEIDRRRIERLYAKGLTCREIGEKTGHAANTVANWVAKLELPVKYGRKPQEPPAKREVVMLPPDLGPRAVALPWVTKAMLMGGR